MKSLMMMKSSILLTSIMEVTMKSKLMENFSRI
jgi:hypothetical protein